MGGHDSIQYGGALRFQIRWILQYCFHFSQDSKPPKRGHASKTCSEESDLSEEEVNISKKKKSFVSELFDIIVACIPVVDYSTLLSFSPLSVPPHTL